MSERWVREKEGEVSEEEESRRRADSKKDHGVGTQFVGLSFRLFGKVDHSGESQKSAGWGRAKEQTEERNDVIKRN